MVLLRDEGFNDREDWQWCNDSVLATPRGQLGMIVIYNAVSNELEVISQPTHTSVMDMCNKYGFDQLDILQMIDDSPADTSMLYIDLNKYKLYSER